MKKSFGIIILIIFITFLSACGGSDQEVNSQQPDNADNSNVQNSDNDAVYEENTGEQETSENDKELTGLEKDFAEATKNNTMTDEEMISIGREILENTFLQAYFFKSEEEAINTAKKYFSREEYEGVLISLYENFAGYEAELLNYNIDDVGTRKISEKGFIYDAVYSIELVDNLNQNVFISENVSLEIHKLNEDFKVVMHRAETLSIEVN